MSAFLIFREYKVQREQLIDDTIARARAIAFTLDNGLASIESGLHVLSKSSELASDDLAGFYRYAKTVLPSQSANNYVLIDPSGRQRLNTLRPYGDPLPVMGSTSQLLQIFEKDATVVSDMFIGPVTGKPILSIGVPVHRNGKIVYSLNVGIFPERVAAMLQRQRLPPDWIGAVIDQSGTLIARTHEMGRFVGKKAAPDLIKAARESAEGTVETVTLEGIPVITAFSRSELSNWTVALGIPESTLTERLKKSLWLLIVSNATLLFGGLWLAWYRGNLIAKTIRGLILPAMELGSGKAVRVPSLHLKEADEVAQALVVASDMLTKAQHNAHYDVLTGLANRALFLQILNEQLAICMRRKCQMTVLYIDLDGFKTINDLYGHAIGDDLLRAAATRIKSEIRASDVAARFGGDEFLVLLVQSGVESAKIVAEKLVASLSASYPLHQLKIRISASIGIAVFPDSATSNASLLERADAAMYDAKKSGKNRYAMATRTEAK